jgi:hypothetical protein
MDTSGSAIMGVPIAGCSAIIGPDGRLIEIAKTPGEEPIIADLDLADATRAKLFGDASGHCNFPLRHSSLLGSTVVTLSSRTCKLTPQCR